MTSLVFGGKGPIKNVSIEGGGREGRRRGREGGGKRGEGVEGGGGGGGGEGFQELCGM